MNNNSKYINETAMFECRINQELIRGASYLLVEMIHCIAGLQELKIMVHIFLVHVCIHDRLPQYFRCFKILFVHVCTPPSILNLITLTNK